MLTSKFQVNFSVKIGEIPSKSKENKMGRITYSYIFGLFLANMLPNGFSLQLAEHEPAFFDEVSRELPVADCDMIVVSSSPLQGEMLKIVRFIYRTINHYQNNYMYSGIGTMARSSIYFTSLKTLYSTWNEQELARQVAFMPCLVALIKATTFEEALNFVDLISSLKGNPVKSTRKYLVLNTPSVDQSLLQNKTGNINVHIISEGERGWFSQIVVSCE